MITLRKPPVAAPRSAEAALYGAETARPGSVVDIVLSLGQSLSVEVPPGKGNFSRRSRLAVHTVEDDTALCLLPPRGFTLRAKLEEASGSTMADLIVVLPPDVCLAVLHPARGVLSLRPGADLTLEIEEI